MSICKHLIIDFAGGSGYKMKKDEGNVANFIADLNLLIDNNNYNKIHCDINRMGVWSVFTNYIFHDECELLTDYPVFVLNQ